MKQRILLTIMLWLSLLGTTWAQSNALRFDGTDDYVVCPAINPTAFTVGAWVAPYLRNIDQAVVSTLSELDETGMELHIGTDNIPVLTIRSGSNWVDVKGATAVASAAWTHVSATCNGYTIYLYVDGKQDKVVSLTDGYTPGTQPLCIGRRAGTSAYYFNGKIDEVSMWNQAISMSKITATYERGITGSETGLMAYYKFDQGISAGNNSDVTTLVDATTLVNHGILKNFTLNDWSSNWLDGYSAPVHSTTPTIPPALGEGSSEAPYQIATIENLYWLSQNSSEWTGKYFIQTADIDLAAISNWMPIGSGFVPFSGTYDGDGHTIRNLTINSNLYGRALFGTTSVGTVLKNLNFENANISNTTENTAILVASLKGTVSNCHSKSGSVTGRSYSSGICAYLSDGTITNSSNSATITGTAYSGGIVGSFYSGKIEFCHNTGAVTGTGALGGIVGGIGSGNAVATSCTITNCYNTANITNSGSYSGGIIGLCSSVNLSKCYSTGTATGYSHVGGLIGWCNPENVNNISYSYCLQSPVIGEYAANSINTFTGVSTKTTTQLQTQSTFSGWDFVGEAVNGTYDYWAITPGFNGGYPTLGNLTATCTNGVVDLNQQPADNVYTWYKVNGTKLTEGVDYIVENGMYKFLKLPGSKIYCTVTNASFPTWLARTNTVTVDKVVDLGPYISFVSEKTGNLSFYLQMSPQGKAYIDWGDGKIVVFDVKNVTTNISTASYVKNSTVKIYGNNIFNAGLQDALITALDVSKYPDLKALTCANNILLTLDLSKNTNLRDLNCGRNKLSTLDLSNCTSLNSLYCYSNQFTFATLPQPKYSTYYFSPQANLPATCTGGIVDLSSQLTAKDGSDQTQTTVYTWYNADGTALVKGVDYDGKDGKFYFMKQPASTVYCNMTNAAFPNLTLRTTDITVDAVLMPEITFASQSFSGDFWIGINSTENTTIYVDKGDGERVAYSVTTSGTLINIAAYAAGTTVKLFSDKIISLSFAHGQQILLDMLDVGKATSLKKLFCPYQVPLNFQTLPQPKLSYTNYTYTPLAQFTATCTDGIVDLSSQLTAKDANDQTQTTVYTWFNADGTELVKGVDYEGKDGKFYFLKQPASTVYCKMYNAAFPDLSGDNAFRTVDIFVDEVLVHSITYVSEKKTCWFNLEVSTPDNVYFDAGDGNLKAFDLIGTLVGIIGVPVKIFGDNINSIESTSCGLTNLDVSNNLGLEYLSCEDNKLTSLDVSKNTALTALYCEMNQLDFATLPQVKATYVNYSYAPQNYFPASCTNGVVDLSSQLTAKDVNDQTQTTVYTWYKTDGTALTANVDYLEENGVFTFVKMPATAVYCQMYNAAFPNLSGEKAFRTVDITVDTALEPSITFVSDNTGDLSFGIALKEAGKVYIDWGNGNINEYNPVSFQLSVSNYSYFSGNTVNVYCNNISDLNVANQGITSLELNNNPNLNSLECQNNKFNFKTLSNIKGNIATFSYSPQSNLTVACTNGVVDLSDQLTATDLGGNTQTTAYSWFLADGTPLTAGTDYIEEAGVFRFMKMPTGSVYCTLTNAAFPGLTLRTVDMTIDAVAEPNITLVSENSGDLLLITRVQIAGKIFVDWGNGSIIEYNTTDIWNNPSTTSYQTGSLVKIYSDKIEQLNISSLSITNLGIHNAPELTELICHENKLASLDVNKAPKLKILWCYSNQLTFATLPQPKFKPYLYGSQANLPATCTNGVVDLSSQLTATDIDGNLQTTTYSVFNADGSAFYPMAYMVNKGKIYFHVPMPLNTTVFCQMTNPAFPNLILRTQDFTVDIPATFPEPDLTFTSEKEGNLEFSIASNSSEDRNAYIDWGDGVSIHSLINNTLSNKSTSSYIAGQTVKVYADDISKLSIVGQGIKSLDVSKCTTLAELDCSQNSLTALNVANNTELTRLECYVNNMSALSVDNNTLLQYLSCNGNINLSTLNLTNNTALTSLDITGCNFLSLDVSKNTALAKLHCQGNKLSTLNVSQNTLLTSLNIINNLMNFSSLPQPKASFAGDYAYFNQANFTATCTNGVVDLSSQLTAVDVDGNTQTTRYSWYFADDFPLTYNFMGENGVFRFVLDPGTVVYCLMTNPAFPALTLRTENITIDAKATLPEPDITFVSENSGSVNISVDVAENSTVYVDWGDGNLQFYNAYNGSWNDLSTSTYVANSTVKVYGSTIFDISANNVGLTSLDVNNVSELASLQCFNNKLQVLDVSNNTLLTELHVYDNLLNALNVSQNTELVHLDCENNNLSVLDVNSNTMLRKLYCSGNNLSAISLNNNTELTGFNCSNNNLSTLDVSQNTQLNTLWCDGNKLNYKTLPQPNGPYSGEYHYELQQNYTATCTNGVVDLSSQLTAVDKEGFSHNTVYTWYKTGNSSSLTKGTDYVEYNGVFRFLQQPDTTVYCQMKNGAFPDLTLGTEPIAIDDVVKPAITFVSEMSGLKGIRIESSENGKVYIDKGNGELLAYDLTANSTKKLFVDIAQYQTVRIFGNDLTALYVNSLFLTDLNVSQCSTLKTLECTNNMLTSLDLTQLIHLENLECRDNKLDFASLPQPSASYFHYVFAPQANLNVACSSGMVDLSAQRTAKDANGTTQTTVYNWYRTDGYQLIEDTHYLNLNGVFVFRFVPSEHVYCTLTNEAFPGLTLRTENITIDAVAPTPNVWLGTVDTDWHTAGNWAGGVPSTIDYIEISSTASNQPVISSSVNASFLSIESGAKVTIAPNGSLQVYESLINNRGTEGLVIKSDATGTGKFFYNKAGVQATVEQYIVKDQWHYITSPVVEALNVNPLFKNFYAVSHTEAQSEGNNNGNCWNYLYTGDQIVAGMGYGVQYNRKDTDNDTIVTFRGELVGPEYVIATKYTGANFGWNLLGNPYPCTISWNATQKGNIQDAVYVYDPATSNYMSYVNGLGSNGGSEFLAPMQGFFVRAKSPNATLNINYGSKRENESSFKGATMQSLIRLSATDAEGRKDESLVRWEPAATAQFDDAFDAYKLKASATPQLYSVLNGDEYSINSIPEATVNTVIPFELLVKTTGTQQIAATELTGLDATLDVVLEDLQTGARTLLANSAYRFSATAGETRKFNLLFADATSVGRVEARTIKAYGAENRMCISNMSDGRNIVAVYNLNGQLVHQTNAEGSYTEVELPNGLYVVKVTPENGNVFNGKVRIGSFK